MIVRPEGLYCPAGDFYMIPVVRWSGHWLLMPHDHARSGHKSYLVSEPACLF